MISLVGSEMCIRDRGWEVEELGGEEMEKESEMGNVQELGGLLMFVPIKVSSQRPMIKSRSGAGRRLILTFCLCLAMFQQKTWCTTV